MAEFQAIHAQKHGQTPSEHFVFGECNSGTNLADALLKANIPALAGSAGDRIGPAGFRYGWKHGFPQMVAAPQSALAIAVFREPGAWLRSMHRRPWHSIPALRELGFSEFIRAEWITRVDEQNFGVRRGGPRWGAELQYDRHPLTGQRFENICALRRAKNAGFISLTRRFANCLLIRHEELTADPEGFVSFVAERYGFERGETFEPVERRRGRAAEGKFSPVAYEPLSKEDAGFVWGVLDTAQERALGFERETR